MSDEKLSKKAVISLLSSKLNCTNDSLVFLFGSGRQLKASSEALEIPDQRAAKQ